MSHCLVTLWKMEVGGGKGSHYSSKNANEQFRRIRRDYQNWTIQHSRRTAFQDLVEGAKVDLISPLLTSVMLSFLLQRSRFTICKNLLSGSLGLLLDLLQCSELNHNLELGWHT